MCLSAISRRGSTLQKLGTQPTSSLPISSQEKKIRSIKQIKYSVRAFLFGAWKPLFLGMRQLRFLSEASWETVTFVSIHFTFLNYCLFLISF